MPLHISSKQNPKIKQVLNLQKHTERRKTGLFTCEGMKEQEKLLASGYQPESVFYCPEILSEQAVKSFYGQALPDNFYSVSGDVYEKIAYRGQSGGILCIASGRDHLLPPAPREKHPIYLVIEGIEKPGNIGAIFRTADAAGINGIILADERTDLYNPNAIRASLGCIFTVPAYIAGNAESLNWLKQHNIQIFTTWLEASHPYHQVDYTQACAIVLGTEADGISPTWVEASDKNIIIPMRGKADSLNVASSGAILLYEAMRQRGF